MTFGTFSTWMFRALGASTVDPVCNDLLHAWILVFWLLSLKLVGQNTNVTLSFCFLFFSKYIVKVFQIARLRLWEVFLIRCDNFSILELHIVCHNASEVIISLLTGIWIQVLTFLSCNHLIHAFIRYLLYIRGGLRNGYSWSLNI